MTCFAGRPTFRLLNARVGWTDSFAPPDVEGLTNWDSPDGIQLAPPACATSTDFDVQSLLAAFTPRRLASGCGPGSWLLLTREAMVLRRNPCTGCWHPVWHVKHPPNGLRGARALASNLDRFAIAAPEGLQVWTIAGEALVAEIRVKDAEAIAFDPWRNLFVATLGADGSILLQRFGPVGDLLDRHPVPTKVAGPLHCLSVDLNEQVWLVTGNGPTARQLWRGALKGTFVAATAADLAAATFPPTGLVNISSNGFCLQETQADGVVVTSCTSWDGCSIPVSCVPPPAPPTFGTSGSITSGWIDSGISRCRWHRVRVDADTPPGSGIEVAVITTDVDLSDPTVKSLVPSDFQTGPAGAVDVLIQQPPGRYLRLALTLTGDGTATPVVRSVRIDFPRRTSLDWLPAIYRANRDAEDFSERFLANFDASIEDLDAAISRFPALLDTQNVKASVLPWLGTFLDVVFDPTWCESKRRNILNELPTLYGERGTLTGLSDAINLIFGQPPVIRELAAERAWGALAESSGSSAQPLVQPNAVVGSVRLFGKAKARFRLGHSALGVAPIHAYGNPDLDALNAEAYRFEVQVPPGVPVIDPVRLKALIESQKPAHTLATIRIGGEGFVVGVWSSVGVDTAFVPLPAPTLGAAGNVRLRRASLVAAGEPRGRLPLAIDVSSLVGVQTMVE
jgi:phage tail-like protein